MEGKLRNFVLLLIFGGGACKFDVEHLLVKPFSRRRALTSDTVRC